MRDRTGAGPGAWLLWFLAAGATPLTSRHPLYLVLTLLAVLVVHLSVPGRDGSGRSWRLFAYIGSSVAALSIGFNVLTVHSGDHPFAELPSAIPIAGGALTYNAFAYGVASALAISSLLFAAATFNTAVRHAELIRRLPGPLKRLGVASAIALNFVPQTMQAGRDIYDTQRARGRSMRGIGDARAFVVPLLGNGLERAVQMSEAMETRGYGRSAAETRRDGLAQARIPLAIALIILAFPLVATGHLLPAGLVGAAAVAVVVASRPLFPNAREIPQWRKETLIVAIPSLISLAIVGLRTVTGDGLAFSPFPRLAWPEFDLAIAAAIFLLLTPAVAGSGNDHD